MNKKFTVIYTTYVRIGSHTNQIVLMERLRLKKGETLEQALERKDLYDKAVFIFEGHPKLENQ